MKQSAKSRGNNKVTKSNPTTPIVAIGASAGGLEAMIVFLDNLAADTGFAFVYLQHLSANHESQLASLLSHHTKMKVVEITKNVAPEPNTIYVLTPATDLVIENGEIVISKRNVNAVLHLPIDRFFNSLAENHKGGMIGLILSGTAFDGTIGLKAIKAAGGITFAQDGSAKFRSMPQSVISAGVVDKILSPAQMADELTELAKHTEQLERIINPNEPEFDEAPVEDVLAIISLIKKICW